MYTEWSYSSPSRVMLWYLGNDHGEIARTVARTWDGKKTGGRYEIFSMEYVNVVDDDTRRNETNTDCTVCLSRLSNAPVIIDWVG